MTKKNKLIIFFGSFILLILAANFAWAQDFGLQVVENNLNGSLGETGTDPRILITRIIQIFLSFLGIIALLITLYAGVLWMTSGGNEEKIEKAKKILRNAVIGLIIILSSWAITTYIISRLTGGLGTNVNSDFYPNPNIPQIHSLGALGACTIENVYPENNQKDVARNTAITITFKEPVDASSLCISASGDACACGEVLDGKTCNLINPLAIRIYKNDLDDACTENVCPDVNSNITEVTASLTQDAKTVVLSAKEYFGDGLSNLKYSIKLTDKLKKIDGRAMLENCRSSLFIWTFEVSSRLDLTPPLVVYGSLFPRPDNQKDFVNQVDPAESAKAKITTLQCPNIYKPAAIVSVTPSIGSPAASAAPLNYQGDLQNFLVMIPSESKDKAQLFNADNLTDLLGVADFDPQGNARFGDYFLFKATDRSVGNSWKVVLTPEIKADTLTVGSYTYTFSNLAGANNIVLPDNCQANQAANAIYVGLSGDPLINTTINGNTLDLTAKVAGLSGNEINLVSSNLSALRLEPFSGGVAKQTRIKKNDQRDVPMNTVIQLNFNEPVNPLQVAGLASEVSNYIRVVNYDQEAKNNGDVCAEDSDCKSYNCGGTEASKKCIGDYLAGKFLVSNLYRTVEFISDKECGVNGCGEKIYCLPANSHLAVEIKAADLKICENDNDCLAFSPFNKCAPTNLGYATCQNDDGRNYPASRVAELGSNGVIDLALNSFDGNRNAFSDGPIEYYNDNFIFIDDANQNKRDNYRFSFFINDQINLTPPKINTISPSQNKSGIALPEDIKIAWNTLMMNSTLRTGQTVIETGLTSNTHHLINLTSVGLSGLGYWISNENIDTDSDGEPDQTISWIKHSNFSEAMTYKAQVGSGVKDIYQNCYKPSDGEGCLGVSLEKPSCCFGTATNSLDADGNCQ